VAEVVAAVDCGSNSTRLLIEDATGSALAREMNITRLSQGVDATGRLVEDAMERTYDVLRRYRALCDEYHVSRGLLVATSAVRDAGNGARFLMTAQGIAGFAARTLSGDEEAAFSVAGSMKDLDEVDVATVIVDIGGGSTELALAFEGEIDSYSMQLGCVRVTERVLGSGIVGKAGAVLAGVMIDDQLDQAFAAVPEFSAVVGNVRLVGLAGTVATLAQLDAGLTVYDRDVVHHRVLTRTSVQHWLKRLANETPEERLQHPGMVVGREDVLVAGLYILDAVMNRFGVDALLSSENDILDGIADSLLEPRLRSLG
jgi:exopolyphosphatase/guanosine-5'-triphosphate,3'-diphosphate pyrophosphatase